MAQSGDLITDHDLWPVGPYLDPYSTPAIRSQQQKLSSFMFVVLYPPTDKHINEHTYQYTSKKTQHIINNPIVPYLQARCAKQDEHNQEPVFTTLA